MRQKKNQRNLLWNQKKQKEKIVIIMERPTSHLVTLNPYFCEFSEVVSFICQSGFSPSKSMIVEIIRNNNYELQGKYFQKRDEVLKDTSAFRNMPPSIKHMNLTHVELPLLHGTKQENTSSILKNGFSLSHARSTGFNGKGIYFSQTFSVSHSYTDQDPGIVKSLFICAVIVGDIDQVNNSKSVFDESHSIYNPKLNAYVVYDEAQTYPLYLVRYRSRGEEVYFNCSGNYFNGVNSPSFEEERWNYWKINHQVI